MKHTCSDLHYQYDVLHYISVKETRNFVVFYISLASHTFRTDTIYLNFLLKISPKSNKSYVAYKTYKFSKRSDFDSNT